MVEYLEKGYVLYAMLAIGAICILGRLIANGTYKRLIRQAENMAAAKDSFLKRLKLKYESTYRLNDGVNNVGAFVEKSLYSYKKMGISLRRLESLTIQGALICLFIGVGTTLAAFLYQAEVKTMIMQFGTGIILGLGLVVVDSLTDTGTKREVLFAHISDYLENSLFVRTSAEHVEEEEVSARRKMKDDVFVRRQKEKAEIEKEKTEQQPKNDPVSVKEAAEAAMSRKKENQSDIESLKKSLAQIAAVREEKGGDPRKEKKLSPKEEKLIADIIQEYLQ